MVDPYWPPEAFIAHPTNSSSDIELELQDFTSLKSEHDQENGLPQQQQQGILDELSVMPLSQPTIIFSTPPRNTHQQHNGLSSVTQERNILQEMYMNKNIGDTDSQNAVKSPSCCNSVIVVEKQEEEGQKTDNEESDSTVNYNNENPVDDSDDSDSKIHHSAKKSSAKRLRVLHSESESDTDKPEQLATDENTHNDTVNESGSEYTPDSDTESEDAGGSDITEASASELPSVSESETSDDSKSSTCSSGSKYVPSPSTSKGQRKKQRELRSERVRSTSSSSSSDDFKCSHSSTERRQKGKRHKHYSNRRNSSSSAFGYSTSKNKRTKHQSRKISKRKRKDSNSGMDASFYRKLDNKQEQNQMEEEKKLDDDPEYQQELADYRKSSNKEKMKYPIEKTLRQLLYSAEQFKNYVTSRRYVNIVDPAILHVVDRWITPKAELVESTRWRRDIKEAVSSFSVATFDKYLPIDMECECCGFPRTITKLAKFKGNTYSRDTLLTDEDEFDEEVTKEKKFKIGDDCRANLKAFHDIHHWLYHFKSRALDKIDEVKAMIGDDVEEIVTSILQDEDWIEKQIHDITRKLTNAEERKLDSKYINKRRS